MIRTISVLAAAISMALAPVAAQAAQAAPARLAAPVSAEADELGGNPFIFPLILALVAALGIILVADGDDSPTSP